MEALALRKSHRYVGTYQHEDQWEEVGTVKVLASTTADADLDDDDETEPRTTTMLVEIDRPISVHVAERALSDTYTKAGCHHEYDCCGCRSFYATADHLRDNLYRVVITSSRNF